MSLLRRLAEVAWSIPAWNNMIPLLPCLWCCWENSWNVLSFPKLRNCSQEDHIPMAGSNNYNYLKLLSQNKQITLWLIQRAPNMQSSVINFNGHNHYFLQYGGKWVLMIRIHILPLKLPDASPFDTHIKLLWTPTPPSDRNCTTLSFPNLWMSFSSLCISTYLSE